MNLLKTIVGADSPTISNETVNIETAFDVLANDRRRMAIKLIAGEGEPWSLGDLSVEIARRERGYQTSKAVRYAERQSVYVGFYQSHLDRLEDVQAITTNGDEICPGPNAEALADLVALVEERVDA